MPFPRPHPAWPPRPSADRPLAFRYAPSVVERPILIAELIDRAVAAERALADLGESVEDEWSYVNDLDAAWATRFAEVAAARGGDPAPPATIVALDEAIAETDAIEDPHRAIDWLSTFPQVVLLALGERA